MRFTGFSAQGSEEAEPPLDLLRLLVSQPNAAYFAVMSGEAMRDAGIRDGDLLIIEAAEHYANGQIVLVFVEGVEIIRRLLREPNRIALQPAHPDFPTLELDIDGENWLIRGRVRASVTLHAPARSRLPVVN